MFFGLQNELESKLYIPPISSAVWGRFETPHCSLPASGSFQCFLSPCTSNWQLADLKHQIAQQWQFSVLFVTYSPSGVVWRRISNTRLLNSGSFQCFLSPIHLAWLFGGGSQTPDCSTVAEQMFPHN